MKAVIGAMLAVVLVGACAVKDPLYCQSNADCVDPERPVCDVAGAFAESDHIANTCISRPADCPAEVCGCTPGEFLGCTADAAQFCAASGMATDSMTCTNGCSTDVQGCTCTSGESVCADGAVSVCQASGAFGQPVTCPLGCAADGLRCVDVGASNGLDQALDAAVTRSDFTLGAGTTFDTSTGAVSDPAVGAVPIPSIVVTQANGVAIRAFIVKSITLSSATVSGQNAFAIVADGAVQVVGQLRIRSSGNGVAPGSASSAGCTAGDAQTVMDASGFSSNVGAGGAGHATAGGVGGGATLNGGAIVGDSALTPLRGGCRGGTWLAEDGRVLAVGGAGGGAVQVVSRLRIEVAREGNSLGSIDVGGTGGAGQSAGGGAGGSVLLEAPRVVVDGVAAGIFANGGGGGGCERAGADASASLVAAPGGSNGTCTYKGGDGGTGTLLPTDGAPHVCGQFCTLFFSLGGGGGAVGRVRVNTANGSFVPTNGAIISASSSVGTLHTR